MPVRDATLQDFLTGIHDVLARRDLGAKAFAALNRIHDALAVPGAAGSGHARRLPVCACLPEALATARAYSASLSRIVDAFAVIEPALFWAPRAAGGPHASPSWAEGHANATIVGPNGIEVRSDVQIGVSLLAPHVRYPDHNHSPEEIYLVLSPGRFQHGLSGWFERASAEHFTTNRTSSMLWSRATRCSWRYGASGRHCRAVRRKPI